MSLGTGGLKAGTAPRESDRERGCYFTIHNIASNFGGGPNRDSNPGPENVSLSRYAKRYKHNIAANMGGGLSQQISTLRYYNRSEHLDVVVTIF